MNINLDNYESFFLMYVDNELSATERKSVEEFLGEYPYLQEEMNLLKGTVLAPEPTGFIFKATLLKPVLSEEALQENLLLHLDNELTGTAKQDLEKILLTDEKLQQEWSLLKRTQLDASEAIVFPGINSLYRHETGRLVIGRFARWVVAAAVIAGGLFTGIALLNSESGRDPIAVQDDTKMETKIRENTNTQLVKPEKDEPKAGTGKLPAEAGKENTVGSNNNLLARAPAIDKHKSQKPAKGSEIVITDPGKEPKEKAVGVNDIPTGVEPVLKSSEVARINKPLSNEAGNGTPLIAAAPKSGVQRDINIQPVENLFAKNASLGDDEENSDDHIFMMDEEKVSRTKAAGFLKKIKRTVERTTKIKPGNSLRIAGFEFAVK